MNSVVDIRESVTRLRSRSLVQEVRDELERMILTGELTSGQHLNEVELAKRLGVSRGPVREAARSLERGGLVVAVANQGVFVRELSQKDILELYDLRAMIAGYICARVAEHGTQEQKSRLRGFVTDMDDAINSADEDGYFQLNIAFHDHIAALSGAERATELYVSLGKEVQLMRYRVLTGPAAIATSNAEHDLLVAAIEQGDIEGARAQGAQHHLNGKKRLEATF